MADFVMQLKCQRNASRLNFRRTVTILMIHEEPPSGQEGPELVRCQILRLDTENQFQNEARQRVRLNVDGHLSHTSAPCTRNRRNHSRYLNANKEKLIGKAVRDKIGADLPFLPKNLRSTCPLLALPLLPGHCSYILSVAMALPLQIYPDKGLTARLHEKDAGK